jgi:hypothetical protein
VTCDRLCRGGVPLGVLKQFGELSSAFDREAGRHTGDDVQRERGFAVEHLGVVVGERHFGQCEVSILVVN